MNHPNCRHRRHRPRRHGRKPHPQHGQHGFTVAAYNRTTSQGGRIPRPGAPRARASWAHTPWRSWWRPAEASAPRDDAGQGGRSGGRFDRAADPAARAGRHHHRRRQQPLSRTPTGARRPWRPRGLLYIGTGVSGGEEARARAQHHARRHRPAAWPHVKPIFQAIAAKTDERRALLRLGGRRRRRALRQDGAQRHRIRRHADDLRDLPDDEGGARSVQRRHA
jgi:hypothetical protein